MSDMVQKFLDIVPNIYEICKYDKINLLFSPTNPLGELHNKNYIGYFQC